MSGEGSVFRRTEKIRRSDGTTLTRKRWLAQVTKGPRDRRDTRRRYAPLTDNTRSRALALLEELRRETAPVDRTTTLGAYLRSWLDDSARSSIRPATWTGYDVIVRHHLEPLAGVPLAELKAEQIERVLNRSEASPKTIRNVQLMLRRALRVAEERGHVEQNVARLVPLRKVRRRTQEPMTADVAQRIRAAFADDRYAAAIDVALLGLRQGEVLGLAWRDLDLSAGVANVRYELVRRNGRYVLDDVKSDASAAPVPLPRFVVDSLAAHRVRQLQERVAAGKPTEDGLVFVTERGRPVSGPWLTKHFQARLAEAGIPRITFHALRHGTASLLAAAGVHPKVAQRLLRHEDEKTTLRVYTHVSAGQEREAVDVLERMIVGGVG
jgi:integrase